MNYVSSETAKRLKEAGYPQPDFKTGQVWYGPNGTPVFIGPAVKALEGSFRSMSIHTGVAVDTYPDSIIKDACCFAPTATDLLKELGEDYAVYYMGGIQKYVLIRIKYSAPLDAHILFDIQRYESAAEACAAEWLDKKG